MFYIALYVALITGAFCTLIANTAMRHDDRHSVGKFGWMVLVLLTPPIGLLLFMLLSGRKLAAEKCERETIELPRPASACVDATHALERIATARGLTAASRRNHVTIVDSPQAHYRYLLELVESATERLVVYSFIMDDDALSRQLIERMCDKANQGVQTYLMIDGFGSFLFPEEMLHRLREAGGNACRFKPISQISRFAHLNFRNHRKLVVADGRRALLGGANMVSYEISDEPDDETWLDLSLRIDGFAAYQIERVFAEDWEFSTGQELRTERLSPIDVCGDENTTAVQVVPIGPDGPHGIVDDLWLSAIHRAQQRVWIVTPYFVPPVLAMQALVMALRRGVEVRLIIPDQSDMFPADWARLDYCRELAHLGTEVLRYPNRMIHAKLLVVDNAAYVGSANFDERSFYLNYELMVGLFSDPAVAALENWFETTAATCLRGTRRDSRLNRILGTAARLFAEQF